jgi:hypothetical protein
LKVCSSSGVLGRRELSQAAAARERGLTCARQRCRGLRWRSWCRSVTRASACGVEVCFGAGGGARQCSGWGGLSCVDRRHHRQPYTSATHHHNHCHGEPSTSGNNHNNTRLRAGQRPIPRLHPLPCSRYATGALATCLLGQLTSPGRKRNLCRPRCLHLRVWPFAAQGAGSSHPPEQAFLRHGQPQSSPDGHFGRLCRPRRLQMVRLSRRRHKHALISLQKTCTLHHLQHVNSLLCYVTSNQYPPR